MKRKKYKPLPETVTINKSMIEGLGLFATKDIKKNTNLGMMHLITEAKEVIRTPLGGFINHALKPNCELVENGNQYILRTLRNILPNEELTVRYSLEQ